MDAVAVLRNIEHFLQIAPYTYKALDVKVHQTVPIEIPEFVVDIIREQTHSQDRFIKTNFGAEFATRIRGQDPDVPSSRLSEAAEVVGRQSN